MSKRDLRRVVAVAYDNMGTFELGIVSEIFGLPRPELGSKWYSFQICSAERSLLRATGGLKIQASRGFDALKRAGSIVIPGWNTDEIPSKRLVKALRHAHDEGGRLVSICSGVFVLAATGLLDGKRATTHWRYAEKLSLMYPKIRVQSDVLYTDEGTILTSAGSAAGIDLCLHIVRKDFGAEIVNNVARRLVMPPHRDGGQSQFIPRPIGNGSTGNLSKVLEWLETNLHHRLSVQYLAKRSTMSARTFARQFRQQTGTTPHKWVTHLRLLTAQRLLEQSNDSIDRVAELVGWKTAATLRQRFSQTLHTTPTSYRRRFSLQNKD